MNEIKIEPMERVTLYGEFGSCVVGVNHFIPSTHKRRNFNSEKNDSIIAERKSKSTHMSFFYFLDQMAGADAIPGRSMIASQHVLREGTM